MTCAWVELTTARAYREETGLYYRKCKQPLALGKSFCSEHQERFDFLMTKGIPYRDAQRPLSR